MVNIPNLVKDLRERLGLTQEQFAHEVGVTCSTVNQWENGRRLPQPFLLKRLLEIEAPPDENSANRLTKREAQAFRKRWEKVNAAEKEELASTPMIKKFRQVAALLMSAKELGWPEALEADGDQDQWGKLRKAGHV